jgi:ketosteroid isomerase-like protein
MEWFARRGRAIEVEQLMPKEFIAQGNRVIVLCEERSRVKATGKSYEVAVMAAWTLLHGVVTHYREAYDTAAVVAALQND